MNNMHGGAGQMQVNVPAKTYLSPAAGGSGSVAGPMTAPDRPPTTTEAINMLVNEIGEAHQVIDVLSERLQRGLMPPSPEKPMDQPPGYNLAPLTNDILIARDSVAAISIRLRQLLSRIDL